MKEEIKTTPIWQLYERGVNFNRLRNIYDDTDKNYRMYNGNQWEGLESGSIEPISYNIIKPIVKHKVGTLNDNLWSINYSSENFDDEKFMETAKDTCEKLNKHASRIWEKDDMDTKVLSISKDSCINSEGILYVDYNNGEVVNEIIEKTDIYYGNENSTNIQKQPYIIIKTRKPLQDVIELARENNVSEELIKDIMPDTITTEEAGESAKYEVNDMVTLLTKMWKENGEVKYTKATKQVIIMKDIESGLTLYPVEHFIWEDVKGSARGIGEVKYIRPNQLEINKTAMRRALSVKMGAYPKPVINQDLISNPQDIDKIGVALKATGTTVDDVRKVVNWTTPSQMSSDAEKLQQEMISNTRELNNAGDIATGTINPEQASGKAILAIRQANDQPLNEQKTRLKTFIEGIARIWFDMWKAYSSDGKQIVVEENVTDEFGEVNTQERVYTIPSTVLEALKTSVKVDITPTGAFDRYAVELSLENLFTQGHISFDEYVKALPAGSVMPKNILEEILEDRKKAQQEIAQTEIEASKLQSQVNNIIGTQEQIDMLQEPVPAM